MRIWRFDSTSMDLGVIETKRCDSCEKDRPFKLFLHYRYARISYSCSWTLQKKYLLLCDACRRGVELDWRKVETERHRRPISPQRRHGWSLFLAVIAIVAVSVTVGNDRRHTGNRSSDGPQPDGAYVVKLSKLLQHARTPPTDGVTRAKAGADEMLFPWPKIEYRRSAAPSSDVGTGVAQDNDGGETIKNVRAPRAPGG